MPHLTTPLEDAIRGGIEERAHAGQRGELNRTIIAEFHDRVVA